MIAVSFVHSIIHNDILTMDHVRPKIRKQVDARSSYMAIVRSVTSSPKGVLGLGDGFVPWGVVQALSKGAVFSMFQVASRQQLDKVCSPQVALVLSGGVGGLCQGLVLSPILLLKTRVVTDPAFGGKGFVDTLLSSTRTGARVIRQEGAAGLFKGKDRTPVCCCKRVYRDSHSIIVT